MFQVEEVPKAPKMEQTFQVNGKKNNGLKEVLYLKWKERNLSVCFATLMTQCKGNGFYCKRYFFVKKYIL